MIQSDCPSCGRPDSAECHGAMKRNRYGEEIGEREHVCWMCSSLLKNAEVIARKRLAWYLSCLRVGQSHS